MIRLTQRFIKSFNNLLTVIILMLLSLTIKKLPKYS